MTSVPQQPADFADIARLIAASRQQAVQTVNILLGGDGVVAQLAGYLAQTQPGLRGFTYRNLFRMRHFYEADPAREIVSALLTQWPWTHHLVILGQSHAPKNVSTTCVCVRCRARDAGAAIQNRSVRAHRAAPQKSHRWRDKSTLTAG
ncbi:DUF1016 N-terminal domain-containing protein [Acidovorax sp. Leaf78]|uniref:DUF1016 N-terminal domain-containing protein n=1 Tax=unclassified Acidovorax TaxID=2684926 RepID=UPI0006F7B8E5|nr:DUF1016 N-terminal domain-containing protein [Acidovorax sp. Leaf78]KQO14919.1 hypothetical protein ASF16_18115 [Acidovorax sp. Leaf78]